MRKGIVRDFQTHWRGLSSSGLLTRLPKALLRSVGYDLVRSTGSGAPSARSIEDLPKEEQAIVSRVMPFTMTSVDRIASLLNAVRHITERKIPGDIAECGVWRGGSMMTVALALLAQGDTSRSLYLYDTFEGMSPPSEHDKLSDGSLAEDLLKRDLQGTGIWCYAGLDDVRQNLYLTGYPENKIHFIKGKVEDTIPRTLPGDLALLRLDTDWYESTKHELTHLFPLLDLHGIMIIDDYGAWQGARKAVDEFMREQKRTDFLHRIDSTGRMLVRTGS